MAPKKGDRLPPPPADLSERELPLRVIKGPVFRIYRSGRAWKYFGKGNSERFDDPLQKYGVLYAGVQAEAAFAEVFIRNLSLRIVAEQDLLDRSLVVIAVVPLKCVDLTGPGLNKVSCDNRIATEKPYKTSGLWSRAFFTHPQKPDGILYCSRHNPQLHCLALFERCGPTLKKGVIEPLMGANRRSWTADQLDNYALPIDPA
jgi:hypothetical protein